MKVKPILGDSCDKACIQCSMDVLICGVCRERFYTLSAFVRHKKSTHVFSCHACQAKYHTEKEATQHFQEAHSIQCDSAYKPESSRLDKSQNEILLEHGTPNATKNSACSSGVSEEGNLLTKPVDNIFNSSFACEGCRKTFTKERQLKSHYCLIQQPLPTQDNLIVGPGLTTEASPDGDTSPDYYMYMNADGTSRSTRKPRLTLDTDKAARSDPETEQQPGNCESETNRLPVFNTEDERLTFHDHIKAVDLTCVTRMYTKHMVSQELKDYDKSLKPKMERSAKDLSVYSCNTCKKVFNCESHMRIHCLSHTTLKPFSCPECDFSTNSRGSLQIHMRVHTGNTYSCDVCPFTTGNVGHLREHKETHYGSAVKCKLCRHSYKTRKSLRNHVLRYHQGRAGKKYLASFKNQCSMSTLHLCQFCNKKFKKKLDRERHETSHKRRNQEITRNANSAEAGSQVSQEKLSNNSLSYICCLCKAVSPNPDQLRQHLKDHLNEKVIGETSPESLAQLPDQEANSSHSLGPGGSSSEEQLLVVPQSENSGLLEILDGVTWNTSAPEYEMDAMETAIFSANLESLFEKSVVSKPSEPVTKGKDTSGSQLTNDTVEKDSSYETTPENRRKKTRPVHQCPYCNLIFKRSDKDLQRHLQVHRKEFHVEVPLGVKGSASCQKTTVSVGWLCEECGETFADEDAWKNHHRIHSTSSTVPNINFNSEGTEIRHEAKELESGGSLILDPGQQMYSCLGCYTTYLNFSDIQLHLKEHHGVILSVADVDVDIPKDVPPIQEPFVTTSFTQ